jgi:ABC-type Mn2+/Zn2+ transport system permease subunit
LDAAWSALTEPLSHGTTARALLEVSLLGIAGGAIGCWVVLYTLSYSAESLAHSMLPGLVVAALTGLPLLLGAALGILAAALAVALSGRLEILERDTGVAVVVTTMFGAGVLLALSPSSPPGIGELLFGDILGVSDLDLVLAAGLVALTLFALRLLHGRLLAVGFDRGNARALGASPLLADASVLILLAIAIVVAVQGLGNLLVVAVLVGPAATARLLARRAAPMIAIAIGIALLGGIGGIYMSYYVDTAAGASIAAMVVALYLVTLTASSVARAASATGGARIESHA